MKSSDAKQSDTSAKKSNLTTDQLRDIIIEPTKQTIREPTWEPKSYSEHDSKKRKRKSSSQIDIEDLKFLIED